MSPAHLAPEEQWKDEVCGLDPCRAGQESKGRSLLTYNLSNLSLSLLGRSPSASRAPVDAGGAATATGEMALQGLVARARLDAP